MIFNIIKTYLNTCTGATAIEYGLIAGLLSILIIAGLIIAGPEIESLFDSIGTELADANS